MRTNFVIYAYPRTGSYRLVSLLNSADDIVCHGEIFKPRAVELRAWYKERMGGVNVVTRDAKPFQFVQKLQSLNPGSNFGFKIFQQHVNRVPYLRRIIGSNDWKKIILVRDPIEVYASLLRAAKTNVWMVKENSNPESQQANDAVTFTVETWKDFTHRYGRYLELCRQISDSIIIHYTDISSLDVRSRILGFLGSNARPEELKEDTVKQFRGTVAEGFVNWDEFTSFMEKSLASPGLPPSTYRRS